jgi:ketosteroid isomerase-like protein
MTAPSTNDPGHALRRAEERIFAAIAARDIAALQAELTDDFVHTTIGGAEQDRRSFLEAIRGLPFEILELRGEGIQVRDLGDVAVLSGVQRARVAMADGSTVSGATAFVDIFVASVNGWRLRHACSIELPAEPAAAD